MSLKALITTAFILCTTTTSLTYAEQSDDRIEWTSGEDTYVFLKTIGPKGRKAADKACKYAGLKTITSPRSDRECGDQFDIVECMMLIGQPLAKITAKLAKSPIWAELPKFKTESGAEYKQMWFAPTYHWTTRLGDIIFRFVARENILPKPKASELTTISFENDDDEDDAIASVVCKK